MRNDKLVKCTTLYRGNLRRKPWQSRGNLFYKEGSVEAIRVAPEMVKRWSRPQMLYAAAKAVVGKLSRRLHVRAMPGTQQGAFTGVFLIGDKLLMEDIQEG